jgi:hypothetical protein
MLGDGLGAGAYEVAGGLTYRGWWEIGVTGLETAVGGTTGGFGAIVCRTTLRDTYVGAGGK